MRRHTEDVGPLAGGGLDRLMVQFPAFRRVGVRAWADYSRRADLSIRGALLYPPAAFGGVVASLAACLLWRRDPRASPAAKVPVHLAAAAALAGLLTTLKAAPFMLSLRESPDLKTAFAGFHRWSAVRWVLQATAFPANVWSLATV